MTDLTHTGGFQDSDYQTAGIDPIRSKLLLDYCIPATSEALEPLGWTVKSKLINGNPRIYSYRIAPYLTLFEEAI